MACAMTGEAITHVGVLVNLGPEPGTAPVAGLPTRAPAAALARAARQSPLTQRPAAAPRRCATA